MVYFVDVDGDGFGNLVFLLDICVFVFLVGYVNNGVDCDDMNVLVNLMDSENCFLSLDNCGFN